MGSSSFPFRYSGLYKAEAKAFCRGLNRFKPNSKRIELKSLI